MFGKIVCGFFGGLMVTFFNGWAFAPVIVLIPGLANSGTGLLFWSVWLIMMVLSVRSSRTGNAWRKVFLTSAALCFFMPFTAILFAGTLASNVSNGFQLANVLGIGGSALLASLFMVLLGICFLVFGLFIGRNKKVKQPPAETSVDHL